MTACGNDRPASTKQLEDVVEGRGIRAARAHDREDLGEVFAEETRGELRLACLHPVDVAAQGVDLPVVREQPVGMRQLPARERVRRVARVDQGDDRLQPRVDEVGVVPRELQGAEHPLVDQRARGEARNRKVWPGRELDHPADDVELPFEGVLVVTQLRRRGHEHVAHARRAGAGNGADVCRVDRNIAPAEHRLPLGLDGRSDEPLQLGSALLVLRQEEHPDAVRARLRQIRRGHGTEKRVGEADEDPGAVAGVGIGAGGAAMGESRERGERSHDGLCVASPPSRATKATPQASCS